MDEKILSYMAGIIDGEGCIAINGSERKQQLVITVANSSELLIQWITLHFGGHVGIDYRENEKHRNSYWWRLYGHATEPFLKSILPYLIIKKPQAELVLEFLKILPPIGGRTLVTDEFWAIRDGFVQQLKQLNKRGR